jgi:lipid-binding SYLF domain-containing protein
MKTTGFIRRSPARQLVALTASVLFLIAAGPARAETMQETVNNSASILGKFERMPEKAIPRRVLRQARGIAVLDIIKGGFVVSGRGGEGVVVARTGDGWSGPSAIATGGAGFGFQIGGEVTEFVLVLNTDAAVHAFSHDGNVSIGGDLSVAAGPVGRVAEGDVLPTAAVYTYSRSKGLFAGVSLEGTVLVTQNDKNASYYGRGVKPAEILSGQVTPPARANRLLAILQGF